MFVLQWVFIDRNAHHAVFCECCDDIVHTSVSQFSDELDRWVMVVPIDQIDPRDIGRQSSHTIHRTEIASSLAEEC